MSLNAQLKRAQNEIPPRRNGDQWPRHKARWRAQRRLRNRGSTA